MQDHKEREDGPVLLGKEQAECQMSQQAAASLRSGSPVHEFRDVAEASCASSRFHLKEPIIRLRKKQHGATPPTRGLLGSVNELLLTSAQASECHLQGERGTDHTWQTGQLSSPETGQRCALGLPSAAANNKVFARNDGILLIHASLVSPTRHPRTISLDHGDVKASAPGLQDSCLGVSTDPLIP